MASDSGHKLKNVSLLVDTEEGVVVWDGEIGGGGLETETALEGFEFVAGVTEFEFEGQGIDAPRFRRCRRFRLIRNLVHYRASVEESADFGTTSTVRVFSFQV